MSDNIFKNELLNYASKLDAVTNSYGKIVKSASLIVEEQDKSATIWLINKTLEFITSEDSSKDLKKFATVFNESIFKYYGYELIRNFQDFSINEEDNDARSLEDLLEDLNKLIGLEGVKERVNDLIAFQTIQMLREKQGLRSQKGTLHLAFTGNPGTGKTTVARIVGRIYKKIGLLSKGHFVEVSRTDLIAGYQGQTALKVKKVIEKSKGGVLFIDEAYSITENNHSDSYGRECLTELTKALEDYRDDLVVIVAGYTKPMEHFFDSNPGLKSRFNTFIEFPDYSAKELLEIFIKFCSENSYVLNEDCSDYLYKFMKKQTESENFANGRFVRNLYDEIIMNHARRVIKISEPNRADLSQIAYEDVQKIGTNEHILSK